MNWMMRRAGILAVFMAAFCGTAFSAVHIETGFLIGTRTVKSADIKSVYGNGMIYYPFLDFRVWKGLSIGAGYEAGYTRAGMIGLYQEPSRLRVTGLELFLSYQVDIGMLSPFLKAGYGAYSYKQTIDSPVHRDNVVEGTKKTWIAAGGIKAFFAKSFFLVGEVRYVPLKVAPVEEIIDLGGLRYAVGFGIKF